MVGDWDDLRHWVYKIYWSLGYTHVFLLSELESV